MSSQDDIGNTLIHYAIQRRSSLRYLRYLRYH
nr:hypothetical protein [Coxiella endosymbiont of Ornithodoros amblus]